MINLSLQKRIKELENKIKKLKSDYKSFEETYSENDRYKIEKTIQEIRIDLNVLVQRIRDLRGLTKF